MDLLPATRLTEGGDLEKNALKSLDSIPLDLMRAGKVAAKYSRLPCSLARFRFSIRLIHFMDVHRKLVLMANRLRGQEGSITITASFR